MRQIETNNWIRVSKSKAKNLFAQGMDVYMLPCRMNPDNMWQPPVVMSNEETSFENLVNHFEYYNCDGERGSYTSFYLMKGVA